MPELAPDHDQWHALVRHLNGMRVTELMRSEPPPHARLDRDMSQLLASEDDSQ